MESPSAAGVASRPAHRVGNDTISGGNGVDDVFGGPGSDRVSATVDGDNPAPDPNPNTDTCSGGNGSNQLFFCEVQS